MNNLDKIKADFERIKKLGFVENKRENLKNSYQTYQEI